MGKKQTFIVEIQDTQYDSWQGSIEWVQGQSRHFAVRWSCCG